MKHIVQSNMYNCRPESKFTIKKTNPKFKDLLIPMENETLYQFISKLQGQKQFTFDNEPNITQDAINGKSADLNEALLYFMNW